VNRRFASLLLGTALCFATASASAQDRRVQLRFQGGAEAGVPIFLNVDRNVVKPGASLTGWGGADIGWVVFEMGFGLQWQIINTDAVPQFIRTNGRQPLIRIHFSPGVRFQVPNLDAVLPYITGAFDANLWQFEAFGDECPWYYCRDEGRARFAPGFTGKVGMGIHLKGAIFLDVGMKYSLSGPGNFFNNTEWWLTPFIGFIYRGDRDRFGGVGY
jgi:hypothetical protein